MRPLAAILCAMLTATTATAQTAFMGQFDTRITGTVEDESGRPLPGYPVIIATEDQNQSIVLFTDKDGTYSVEGLAEGDYRAIAGTDTKNTTTFSVTQPKRRWLTRKADTPQNTVVLPEFAVPLGPVSR
jgi:hypothetical protein